MSRPHGAASDSPPSNHTPTIDRLLFVSDAAVADVDELPTAVRAILDAASEVYVLTPTRPGRLAWLADDVDRFRHYADEQLDTVLSHMHAIGADAVGAAARGSVMTVIADAVTEFEPDHILMPRRSRDCVAATRRAPSGTSAWSMARTGRQTCFSAGSRSRRRAAADASPGPGLEFRGEMQ